MKNMFQKGRVIDPFAPAKVRITIDTNITNGQSEIRSNPPIHALATLQILVAASQGIIQKIIEMESMTVRPEAGSLRPDLPEISIQSKNDESAAQTDGKDTNAQEKSSNDNN